MKQNTKKIQTETAHQSKFLLLLVLLLGVVLMINIVSAFDFDNVKRIAPDGKYSKIIIDNMFGLGGSIAEYTLNKNTDQCLTDCYAEGTATLYSEGQLFQDITFKDSKAKSKTLTNKMLIKNIKDVTETYDDYTYIVNKAENKTEKKYLGKVTKTNTIISWDEYKGENLKVGTYTWRIEGKKLPSESIDWVASSFGVALSEWSWWNTDWGAKKEIKVQDNAGSTITNYTVDLKIPYDSNMSSNYGDLRFVNSAQNTELGYWIYFHNTTEARVKVRIEDNLVSMGNVSIWMYYKNPTATSTSDIAKANILGEDGVDFSEWNDQSGIGGTVVKNTTSQRLEWSNICRDGNMGYINQKTQNLTNFTMSYVYSLIYSSATPTTWVPQGYLSDASRGAWFGAFGIAIDDGITAFPLLPLNQWRMYESKNTIATFSSIGNVVQNKTYYLDISKSGTSITENIWNNSIRTVLNFTMSNTTNSLANEYAYIFMRPDDAPNSPTACTNGWITNFTISKYVFPIPTYSIESGELISAVTVALSTPADAYSSYLQTVNFNATLTASLSNLTNATLNVWNNLSGALVNSVYQSVTGTLNSSYFTLTKGAGNYTWNVYACNVAGACYWASSNRSFYILPYLENSQTYNASIAEGTLNSFTINISYDPTIYSGIFSGTLNYGSQTFTGTVVGNTITTTMSSPAVSIPTNYNFNWTFLLIGTNGTVSDTSSTKTQTVLPLTSMGVSPTNCTSLNMTALFNLQDETTLTSINGTFKYNIYYGLSNGTLKNIYGEINNSVSFALCLNLTASPDYTIGSGEIQYSSVGYSDRRYYLFQNTRLTGDVTNITLYSLPSNQSTSFMLTATNTALEPYVGNFIALLRWYPELNSYKTVEVEKTDDKGQTILKVKTEDVDYRFALYNPDGTLIKLLNPVKMICQSNPCVYTLYIDESNLNLIGYSTMENSLTFNSSSKKFTYIWNDYTQKTQTINLTVWKEIGTDSVVVCSTSGSSQTGILVCDVSAYTGHFTAQVTRTASPATIINQLIVDIRNDFTKVTGGATMGLFIGFILFAFFALMGAYSPVLAIVLGIISLIPLYFLGSITWMAMAGIAVLGGIVLHFLRRAVQ